MRKITIATAYILTIAVILICAGFSVATILATPFVLAFTYSWWWLLIYLCYAVVIYTAYSILK